MDVIEYWEYGKFTHVVRNNSGNTFSSLVLDLFNSLKEICVPSITSLSYHLTNFPTQNFKMSGL